MKRILSVIVTLVLLLGILPPFPASAISTDSNENSIITVDGTLYDADGKVLPTPEEVIAPQGVLHPIRNKRKISTEKKVFTNVYLTGAWANSSGYVVSKGTDITATIKIEATKEFSNAVTASAMFQLDYTRTYRVDTNIPANSARESKLGLYADYDVYTCEKWRVEYNQEEIILETMEERGTVREPTDCYVKVVYKDEL